MSSERGHGFFILTLKEGEMSNEDINKYLTEAMGECWHDYLKLLNDDHSGSPHFICKKCDEHHYSWDYQHSDFFTWQGYGKLWEWATKQEWWWKFWDVNIPEDDRGGGVVDFINPTNFANAIYEYLKEEL